MGESGLSPVLEPLNRRKKDAFVTGSTALGSETETDCARKQTTKKKVQPQNSLGLQSSALLLVLKRQDFRSSVSFHLIGHRTLILPRPGAGGPTQTTGAGPAPPVGGTSCLPASEVAIQSPLGPGCSGPESARVSAEGCQRGHVTGALVHECEDF